MPAGVSAYVPLANITLGSSAASVTFSSISQAYRDLVFVVNATASSGTPNLAFQFNGDTASNYTVVTMEGTGSVTSSASGSLAFGVTGVNSPDLSTTIGSSIIQVMDYTATDKHKTSLGRGNNTANGVTAAATRWANTAAITSVLLKPNSSTFAAGSTFALYGVSA